MAHSPSNAEARTSHSTGSLPTNKNDNYRNQSTRFAPTRKPRVTLAEALARAAVGLIVPTQALPAPEGTGAPISWLLPGRVA